MGWKQCVISIQDSYEQLHEGVRLLALANKDSVDIALFTRTMPDHRHRVLLLSPLAAELAGDALCDRWTASEAPELFEWDLVHGSPGACERFGLCRPTFGRGHTPPLVFGEKPDATGESGRR
ncbi:MAG TPA: hypothetical protein VJS38_07570 [Phenylobacterium sp.]|uniref:hypothetical protein n=1 Tax=Phenylobacterium sp. TaxID=1871053 RepID=UPI002B4854DA|nr:hypothetical protein [Phenylobacterium sp.]HKR88019.1 hypothetical protein [Phenylobacterium sp.]